MYTTKQTWLAWSNGRRIRQYSQVRYLISDGYSISNELGSVFLVLDILVCNSMRYLPRKDGSYDGLYSRGSHVCQNRSSLDSRNNLGVLSL